METVFKYISEALVLDSMKQIDSEIIYEKLNCKILLDVANQIKSIRNTEISNKQKEIEDDIAKNPSASKRYDQNDMVKTKDGKKYKVSTRNNTFKSIFGNSNIEFDKISDSDVKVYEADDKNHDKIVRKAAKGEPSKIYILQDPKTEQYKYYFDCWGYIIYLYESGSGWNKNYTGNKELERKGRQWVEPKQYEKVEMCKGLRIYEIDCSSKSSSQLRSKRYNDKAGIVWFDENSLKQYAKDNLERYKKIISQNKANRLNDDTLLSDIEKVIKKTAELAVECAKDPILNADVTPILSKLCPLIYGVKTYHSPQNYKQMGYYTGENGLLPQLNKYIDYLGRLKKGTDSYYQQYFDETKKNLQDSLKKAKDLLKSIGETI